MDLISGKGRLIATVSFVFLNFTKSCVVHICPSSRGKSLEVALHIYVFCVFASARERKRGTIVVLNAVFSFFLLNSFQTT